MPHKPVHDTILVDGRLRSRVNSLGRVIHPTEEGLTAFWRWFGESSVVDLAGRPLVVYHGTLHDFDLFEPDKGEGGIHFGAKAHAAHFTNKEGGRIFPVYLRIINPDRIHDGGQWSFIDDEYHRHNPRVDGIVYLNRREGLSPEDQAKNDENQSYWDHDATDEEFRAAFPSAQESYIVFSPCQIKSAIGNTGAYDLGDPDISDRKALVLEKVSRAKAAIESAPAARAKSAPSL